MAKNPKEPNLTRQRIFLVVFFGLALVLAILSIVGNLNETGQKSAPASAVTAPARPAK